MPPRKSKVIMPPRKPKATKVSASELPPMPDYIPFKRCFEEHESEGLPRELCTSPLDVFNQLFTQEMWHIIRDNTNSYYQYKTASAATLVTSGSRPVIPRPWTDVTVGELKVWVGLLFYMGLVVCPATKDYWAEGYRQEPMSAMSLIRFQQIKRYLHVSPPTTTTTTAPTPASASTSASASTPASIPTAATTSCEWWRKMEPMSSIALQRCKDCYTPASNVTIDEMMVKCEGQSQHTLTMPNKPIDRGYKLYALCDHGYTYHWIYYSRVDGAATEPNRMFSMQLQPLNRTPN